MTTASKITLVRVVMIPVFMVLLLLGFNIPALVVFIVASYTDFVDGYIARHYNQVSNFGKFLDPLADKLLVISCMVIFIQWGRMPAWAVMIVLARRRGPKRKKKRSPAVSSGRPLFCPQAGEPAPGDAKKGRPRRGEVPPGPVWGMDHSVVQVLVTVMRVMMMALMMPAR